MKALLEECTRELSLALDRFPWEARRAYADWLAQTYYYVRHSTRLLAAGAARLPYTDEGNGLHHRFAAHMAEEKKHELLCVHDIARLGESIDGYSELPATRMFYEPQYFKIEHESPLELFGYILPLEAIGPASGGRLIEAVTKAHGARCASFLKVHTEEDVTHLDKALALVDSFGAVEKARLEENMRQTTYAYAAMLGSIRRRLDLPA